MHAWLCAALRGYVLDNTLIQSVFPCFPNFFIYGPLDPVQY